jgi:hypothetical protein
MTTRRSTRLSVEQCAEIADVCIAARHPGLISTFIRDGTCPKDVRQLLAKLNMQGSEAVSAERFSFASLSGEEEITG